MRLRKLLAEERRSLQQVRQNYNNEIATRTELELVLRDCVEEVRKEAERRYVCLCVYVRFVVGTHSMICYRFADDFIVSERRRRVLCLCFT